MSDGNDGLEGLFEAAIALPAGQRDEFLRKQCPDPALRERARELVQAFGRMSDFLEEPAATSADELRFGPYRAIAELGRGGMSVVYRAERVDGGFAKQVAIKVILAAGENDANRGETQILARLEHANIARLLDAGQTELGFRYLVMELVDGRPCIQAAAAWSEERKLRLLLAVCGAVQYAHAALVVHRDLKPANILVDASGNVKLLDFGIAKLLEPLNARQTRGVPAFTANYASPEQILGEPVTTAADIYSLGALLCELMTGEPPRPMDGLPLASLIDRAREEVGVLQRNGSPWTGDLSLIAGKALRRDPQERYASVEAFAADLERYLSQRPIAARPASLAYRAGRFLTRHRYAVAASVLATLGLTGSAWFAQRQAELAEQRFQMARGLAHSVMFEMHDRVKELKGSLPVEKMIVTRSLAYVDGLAEGAGDREDLLLDAASGYLRLARIQAGEQSLGENAAALQAGRKGLALVRKVLRGQAENRAAQTVLVDTLDVLGIAHVVRGENAEAIPLYREALTVAEKLPGGEALVIRACIGGGRALFESDRPEEALTLWHRARDRALALQRKDPSAASLLLMSDAQDWVTSGHCRSQNDDRCYQEARESYRLARELAASAPRESASRISLATGRVGTILLRRKQYAEAVAMLEEGLRTTISSGQDEKDSAGTPLRHARALNRLAAAYEDWGRPAEALRNFSAAEEQLRPLLQRSRDFKPGQRTLAVSLMHGAAIHQQAGRGRAACDAAREARSLLTNPVKELPAERRHILEMERILGSCR